MNYNKYKTELTEQINKLLGLLISLRTVETSPLSSEHWVNHYIDKLSNYRNNLADNSIDCNLCNGSGAVYDQFATNLSDAECCPECHGNGFTICTLKDTLITLLDESKKNNTLNAYVEEMLNGVIFKS